MSAWIDHVKKWASANGKTYACALSDARCKASYKGGSTAKPEKMPKNPLKGRGARGKYVANETARDALAQFNEMKKNRGKKPIGMVGLSPSGIASFM
jgi:hypothetical protein